MQTNFIRRSATLFAVMLTCLCANAQTFIVSDIVFSNNMKESEIQEKRKEAIGVEVNLLFSDNDVRVTFITKEGAESMILQKIGGNLYRHQEKRSCDDLELNTILGYIRSCKLSAYEDGKWLGTAILKRKLVVLGGNKPNPQKSNQPVKQDKPAEQDTVVIYRGVRPAKQFFKYD